ncbi:MAG: endonuclease [Tannerellaceae bacterium]|jgi:endonuclease/exonuclease/phosphatase family metal-dependent hydrolase|nr:endonuclease [Tannerellaceae bacterium]
MERWLVFGMTVAALCRWPVAAEGEMPFRVVSYNVENLFDVYDDPETEDDEFLPGGVRRWTPFRYNHKLLQIARVIIACGEWDAPALVGLCEVENDTVMTHLLTRTPLRGWPYRHVITTGHDRRGINVALLYRRDKFRYIGHASIPVVLASKSARPTRDILHVWGEVCSGDTLDIMVCHFPSRYGGDMSSQTRRLSAARQLSALSDSLSLSRLNPLQIIMGDFNDEPHSHTINTIQGKVTSTAQGKALGAARSKSQGAALDTPLTNLFNTITPHTGSLKYHDRWSLFDHIIVSRRMQTPASSMQFVEASARIFAQPYLLTADDKWHGQRPQRSYHGFKYEAGFSDHLPVIADFIIHAVAGP